MAGLGRNGTGTAGSHFDSDKFDFPGVPYVKEHFNKFCPLNAWTDEHMMRDCFLVGLTDLDQSNEYVRNKIIAFLDKFIDYGVAGFRVDAAKHMWPKDIAVIQQKVKDLPEGGRPFFVHEVIDQSNGPITTQQYTSLGYVTEFRYCQKIKEGIEGFGRLGGVVDYGWGMTDSEHAFVFVDNHDNQRGHGGGGSIITFEKAKEYKMAVAFTLANDYGFTRVMSSYFYGDNSDQGPPHNADFSTKDVKINSDQSCGNGWVCEHRWRPIANMAAFRNAVVGTKKENYFNQNDQVAFSRGNKGFFAMARAGHMDETLQTGLPAGEYCDLISDCSKKFRVDGNGMAHITIDNANEPIIAFIVGICIFHY
jgi:alpha-amylase